MATNSHLYMTIFNKINQDISGCDKHQECVIKNKMTKPQSIMFKATCPLYAFMTIDCYSQLVIYN